MRRSFIPMCLAALTVQTIAFDVEQLGSSHTVFADMHDGDQKLISINTKADQLTITPYGNKETWKVEASLNKDLTAIIDFNVPGKPNPPPINLTLTLWLMETNAGGGLKQLAAQFTDPSGTLAKPAFPLNVWIQVPSTGGSALKVVPKDLSFVETTMDCTFNSPATTIKLEVVNQCGDNVKVRTCNADQCAGSGSSERQYIDCPNHVDRGTTGDLTLDGDLHFITFISTKTGEEIVESWAPFPSSLTLCPP